MSSADDIAAWDRAATTYAATVGGEADPFFRRFRPFLDLQVQDWQGRRVLDLGCGHGWLAGLLAARGAQVTGVDGSAELIDLARTHHPGTRFDVVDLTGGLPPDLGPFDVVVCHMVLMDVPQVDVLLHDVTAALAPGGVLLASILHPAFFGQEIVPAGDQVGWRRQVRGYLQHEQWLVESFGGHTHYHRPLSWYVQAMSRAGLALTALDEPVSLPGHLRPAEEWSAYETWFGQIPTMLAWAAQTHRS